MTAITTDLLLRDLGFSVRDTVIGCGGGYVVCKTMVTHAGASELECCDCSQGGGDTFAVTTWEERSYPSVFPPLPVDPEPQQSNWVDVHEVHLTVATCWPAFDRIVPTEDDPREDTAQSLAKVRDCLTDWLSSCARNAEQLLPDRRMNVWNRGVHAERAMHSEAGMECRGWEWTLLVW